MVEKILKAIVTDIFIYLFSFVFVYVGFNLLLPQVFEFVPKLSFWKTILLTLAINFISTPIRLNIEFYIKSQIIGE